MTGRSDYFQTTFRSLQWAWILSSNGNIECGYFRAKTHKPIGETLKPIISKYTPELTMEEIIIRKENSSDLINLDDPVLKLR